MRILVAAPGDAYSRMNFVEFFPTLGHPTSHWDFTRDDFQGLLKLVAAEAPGLLIHVLVEGELGRERLLRLRELAPRLQLLQFACDDEWRVNVALRDGTLYDLCATNYARAVPLYRARGIGQVRYLPYGVRTDLFRPGAPFEYDRTDYGAFEYDVTFVGQCYPGRPEVIGALRAAGIGVDVWGAGWEAVPGFKAHGELGHRGMIDLIRTSRINLGLCWQGNFSGQGRPLPQAKGRLFEAAALGAFQLAYRGSTTGFFTEDEVPTWATPEELVEQVKHFLAADGRRRETAARACARAHGEHSWAGRWTPVLAEMEARLGVLSA